eukprot:INCI5389.3.p1 GENE.INCI5389.3~~INCI5389.3.p1  ORF type:complete len:550 (-),score=71.46 INCI5389.3:175-1824(-)
MGDQGAGQAVTGRKRIAVVGSGIAGLSCAYLLSQGGHDVTLFEREGRPGMDAYGVDLENGRRIDTPPRAFSEGFYPNLMAMYRKAGVEYVRWSWAFAACIYRQHRAYFRVGGDVALLGFRLPSLEGSFWKLLLPQNIRMMYDGFRFYLDVRRDFSQGLNVQVPFAEYLAKGQYSEKFVKGILLPMLSMICTARYESVLAYPTGVIMEYWNTNSTHNQFRTVHGSYDAAERLTRLVRQVHLNTAVVAVHGRHGSGSKPSVEFRRVVDHARQTPASASPIIAAADQQETDNNGKTTQTMWGRMDNAALGPVQREFFDEVVLATPANIAPRILVDDDEQTRKTRQHLSGFPYEHSTVVIHRDRNLMPTLKKDWAAMNMVSNSEQSAVMFSMWASHKSVLDIEEEELGPLFQTWNPFVEVSATRMMVVVCLIFQSEPMFLFSNAWPQVKKERLLKRIHFERSIMTPTTINHIRGLDEQQGKGGIWYCGAYALNSIPLQENGVRSAVNIAERLGVECPWGEENRSKAYKVRASNPSIQWRWVHAAWWKVPVPCC